MRVGDVGHGSPANVAFFRNLASNLGNVSVHARNCSFAGPAMDNCFWSKRANSQDLLPNILPIFAHGYNVY